jgi:hypothetical protein
MAGSVPLTWYRVPHSVFFIVRVRPDHSQSHFVKVGTELTLMSSLAGSLDSRHLI